MAEIRTPAKSSKYYISKQKFLTARHFCLQYEVDNLLEMKSVYGSFTPSAETGWLTMYGFTCPSCRLHVYLDQDKLTDYQNGTVNCPVCGRRIYRDGRSTSWEVVVGSRTVNE